LQPVTLTINSTDYTGTKYVDIIYFGTDGAVHHIMANKPISLPIVIDTVLNSGVDFLPSGWSGIPSVRNSVGCSLVNSLGRFYIVPTSAIASVEVYDSD